jgi:hypothetical protein
MTATAGTSGRSVHFDLDASSNRINFSPHYPSSCRLFENTTFRRLNYVSVFSPETDWLFLLGPSE